MQSMIAKESNKENLKVLVNNDNNNLTFSKVL